MNRPAARLWAGALVLGASAILTAGPVRLTVDPREATPSEAKHLTAGNRLQFDLHDDAVDHAFDAAYTLPRVGMAAGVDRANYQYSPGDSRRSTLVIPLPPAVWPAGAMLGAVAIATVLRQHRRK